MFIKSKQTAKVTETFRKAFIFASVDDLVEGYIYNEEREESKLRKIRP